MVAGWCTGVVSARGCRPPLIWSITICVGCVVNLHTQSIVRDGQVHVAHSGKRRGWGSARQLERMCCARQGGSKRLLRGCEAGGMHAPGQHRRRGRIPLRAVGLGSDGWRHRPQKFEVFFADLKSPTSPSTHGVTNLYLPKTVLSRLALLAPRRLGGNADLLNAYGGCGRWIELG